MSTLRMREALALKDGDSVHVELEGDDAWWQAGLDAGIARSAAAPPQAQRRSLG
jgi:hypothetical protein